MAGDSRLSHLQSLIEGYYEQLAGKEKALLGIEPSEKVRIGQQIKALKQEMVAVEREYWVRLKPELANWEISEAEAEVINGEILQEVDLVGYEPMVQGHGELVRLLGEIKTELMKPGTPGAGKLKAVVPLIPGILSYEMELDTEGVGRRLFPIFSQWGKKAKKS
jgi:hypothetical protein